MGSVGSSSSLRSSVDLDVAEGEVLGVKVFDLGVGFEVGQEVQNDLDGFFRPSSLSDSPFLSLSSSASGTSISLVWDASLLFKDLVEVFLSSLDVHSLKGSGGVVGVLEVSSDVASAGLDGYVKQIYTFVWDFWFSCEFLRHSFILNFISDLNGC